MERVDDLPAADLLAAADDLAIIRILPDQRVPRRVVQLVCADNTL